MARRRRGIAGAGTPSYADGTPAITAGVIFGRNIMNLRPQFPDVDAADPSWWALPLALVLAVLGGVALAYVASDLPRGGPASLRPPPTSIDATQPVTPLASAPFLDHSHLSGRDVEVGDVPTF